MRNWSVLLPFALGLAYGVWMITSRLDRLGRMLEHQLDALLKEVRRSRHGP